MRKKITTVKDKVVHVSITGRGCEKYASLCDRCPEPGDADLKNEMACPSGVSPKTYKVLYCLFHERQRGEK